MKHSVIKGATIAIPENYADCITLIGSDYFRWTGCNCRNLIKLWLARWRKPAFGFMFYYRLCEHRGVLYPYFRLRLEKYVRKYALQIPLGVRTGYGLYLGHGTGIIVNASAVIGSNVNLSQFTTIGSMKGTAATVADEAYIGPSVCLVEDVRIGCRSMTGAGAVVVKDVPDGASAAGVPAKIVSENAGYTPANKYPVNIS